MKHKIQDLKEKIIAFNIDSVSNLEQFKKYFIGSKNLIKELFTDLKSITNTDEKRTLGLAINALKLLANEKFNSKYKILKNSPKTTKKINIDLTAPPKKIKKGSIHPISLVQKEIVDLFKTIGFTVSSAQEAEDDWHVFSALNIPEDHPAKDMQDTFFIKDSAQILRSHTSSVQIRVMESEKLPIRTISPGRVYRNETVSARSHCFFHQIEGLYVDKNVSFTVLKATLSFFAKSLFGNDTTIRLRPSYFPFTEPSAEMDVSCTICQAKGCSLCKYTGYIEILGCGMVDPQVLKNCNINSKKFSGFAFGMGVERIAMLKYKINDIRLFSQGDNRFLEQFSRI